MNGLRVPLSRILRGAAAVMGIPWSATEGLSVEELSIVTPLLSNAIDGTWENFAWPELTRSARRYQPALNGTWFKHTGTSAWPSGSFVFHAESNAIYWSTADCPGSEVPGTSSKWVRMEPTDSANVSSFDPEKSYNAGDVAFRPGFGVVLCLESNIGLPVPATPQWVSLPSWSGLFPYDPGIFAEGNAWTDDQRPMGSVLGVWDQDPIKEMATAIPLAYVTTPDGVRVEGDPGSAWFRWIDPVPQITGEVWSAERAYVEGDQFYHQTDVAYGTWYDVIGDLAAGENPTNHPDVAVPILIPARMQSFLIAKLAAAWLRYDGQVDKAADQDRAAQLTLEAAQLQVALIQRQKTRMPVRAR